MALFNQSRGGIQNQFGMPLFGIAGTPPFTGNQFWVDATNGSDGNTGGPQDPLATLTQALALTQNGNNDVVFLSGTVHTTATVTWANNMTHLIGLTAPSNSNRARISATGATAFSPLVNVTGYGCNFINIGTFHGGFTGATGSQVCWNEGASGGGRNYYKNCQFYGGGDATTAALAGMRSLTVTASDENVFEDCTIGLDTIVRATNANASMEVIGGSARTRMLRCLFQANVSDASDVHITAAAAAIDRFLLLQECALINAIDSGATAMSAAITNAGSASVILNGCISIGATAIATTGPVYVNQISAAGATTTGIGIKAT
jgi:hypothetical protein